VRRRHEEAINGALEETEIEEGKRGGGGGEEEVDKGEMAYGLGEHVRDDNIGGIATSGAHDTSTRMSSSAAKVETVKRSAMARVAKGGTSVRELMERKRA